VTYSHSIQYTNITHRQTDRYTTHSTSWTIASRLMIMFWSVYNENVLCRVNRFVSLICSQFLKMLCT